MADFNRPNSGAGR